MAFLAVPACRGQTFFCHAAFECPFLDLGDVSLAEAVWQSCASWMRRKKENRCICSCKWVMQGAMAPGRSEWEPQRVGCWAVLTFASVPLSRGEESSGLSVFPSASPVTLVIRAADGPARPPLFYLSVSVRPYHCSVHPLCPICTAPLEGRLAGQHPFVPLFQCKQTVWSLVLLPVFVRCESRCSLKDLFWLFCPPLKL